MSQFAKKSLALFLLCGLFAGCSGEQKAPMMDVSGQVLLNDEPFSGAAVRFYNSELGGGAFNLNEQGEFESGSPITIGDYMVSLDRPGPVDGENPSEIEWPENRTQELPKHYCSVMKSGLKAQVSVDGENHFVFRLQGSSAGKGKKGADGPKFIAPITGG